MKGGNCPCTSRTKPFCVYDDLKNKLAQKGIPTGEIAYIHDADTDEKKRVLFSKVRSGQIRVLIGSTEKCGAGMNVQDRLVALHHLSIPYRPRDLEQRDGRIIRQGNMNQKVWVYTYVCHGSFDAYLAQMLEHKARFIAQIMTSKTPVRSCDDCADEAVLSYAEIKALCAGDDRIRERMQLDTEIARLKVMKSDYASKKYRMEDDVIHRFPTEIARNEALIAGIRKDMETLGAHPYPEEGFVGMKIHERTYAEKDAAGEALLDAVTDVSQTEPVTIGSYRGLTMAASMTVLGEFTLRLIGAVSYTVDLGDSPSGNLTRVDNALAKLPDRLEDAETKLSELHRQLESAKIEAAKPFAMEEELRTKSARLAELDAALNLEKRGFTEQPAAWESPSR